MSTLHIPDGQTITAGVSHIPLSLHTCAGVTTPAVHDWPAPQLAPACLLVLLSTQVDTPVPHQVTPTLQSLGLVLQARPAVQSTQLPPLLQTLSVPQDAPVDLCVLLLQTIDPVAQLVMPV